MIDQSKPLDVQGLFLRLSITPKRAIHIGAHTAEEYSLYMGMGFKSVLFVEADPELAAALIARQLPNSLVYSGAVADTNGIREFRVTNNRQSSSLLPLAHHAEMYPDITVEKKILVECVTLDTLMMSVPDAEEYNYLHLDIQGAEGMALRGATETIKHIDAVTCELNFRSMYEGCAVDNPGNGPPNVGGIDSILGDFKRIQTFTGPHPEWGDAFYTRWPFISFSKLGQWGRWGNAFFEYIFLKCMSWKHGLVVETPPWIGQQLYGFTDKPLSRRERKVKHETSYSLAASELANADTMENLDIVGVFQYHTSYYAPWKGAIQRMFTPLNALEINCDREIPTVVIHLRRGDYLTGGPAGSGCFFVPPDQWYMDWLRTIPRPFFLYICTDASGYDVIEIKEDFELFDPSCVMRKVNDMHPDWWYDWNIMTQADYLAISNSSFSFGASMLNTRAEVFMRPDLKAGKLMAYDPWNAEPLLHRELGYGHLESKL